ncbi:MAG: L,D-transpeptidase [Actinocrinis sp.]
MGRRGVDPRGSWEDDPSRRRSDGGPGHQPPPDPRYAGQYGQPQQPQQPRGPQYGQPPVGQPPHGQAPQSQPPQSQPPYGQPRQGGGQQPPAYGQPPYEPQPRYDQPRRDQHPDPARQPPRPGPGPRPEHRSDGPSPATPSGPLPTQPPAPVGESRAESRAQSRSTTKKKQGRGATYSVAIMTVASLVGVGILAAQAAATAPTVSPTAKAGASSSAHPGNNAAASTQPSAATDPAALPANSGSGARVVYGVAAKRVWLVSSSNSVARTFTIVPGSVTAPTGSFGVTNKLSAVTGTDGTPVQYVVLFNEATVSGHSTTFGFDAVANVTGLPPAPTTRTGGIRMAQADAQALWAFASLGTTVVVVS